MLGMKCEQNLTTSLLHYKRRDSGLHWYTQELGSFPTEKQKKKVMTKSIDVYKEFMGKHPKGWVAPAWEMSPRSMEIIEEPDVEYGCSMMHTMTVNLTT